MYVSIAAGAVLILLCFLPDLLFDDKKEDDKKGKKDKAGKKDEAAADGGEPPVDKATAENDGEPTTNEATAENAPAEEAENKID